jgi:tRNA (guanine-N7-)-methyltransferase
MRRSRLKADLTPVALAYPTERLDWGAVFPEPGPVELEIGPGKGLFLANAAQARPSHRFIGVEVAHKYGLRAADRAAKLGLSNVRIVLGDARKFLHEFVPERSLHAVHLYFPDPWWKKRHKKRRVFGEDFVADVRRALVPRGELHLATDVEEYFGVMGETMAAHPEYAPIAPPELGEPQHNLDYLTNFERKYRLEGRPIYRASFRLAEPDAPSRP